MPTSEYVGDEKFRSIVGNWLASNFLNLRQYPLDKSLIQNKVRSEHYAGKSNIF